MARELRWTQTRPEASVAHRVLFVLAFVLAGALFAFVWTWRWY